MATRERGAMRRLLAGPLLAVILTILTVSWHNPVSNLSAALQSPRNPLPESPPAAQPAPTSTHPPPEISLPTLAPLPAQPVDEQRITAVWYAADAGEAPHPLRPVEPIRGRPVLQVHYANADWLHPLDLTVELETLNTNWRRRVTWRVTKNWSELEDYVHVMIEPHPICSAGIECRLTIRYGDDVWESRLVWQED